MKKKWYDDSFWHQDFIDLWTIPHSLYGVIFALAFSLFNLSMVVGLFVVFVSAILWEFLEVITKVATDETNINKVSDVFVATVWYGITWCCLYLYPPQNSFLIIWIAITFVVLVGVSALGWVAHYLWHKGDTRKP